MNSKNNSMQDDLQIMQNQIEMLKLENSKIAGGEMVCWAVVGGMQQWCCVGGLW